MKILKILSAFLMLVTAIAAAAQSIDKLTLDQAEKLALENPQLKAANLNAMAAQQVTGQVRSSYFPMLQGNITAADAPDGTRLAAGGLNNPTVYQRYSNGLTASQLITDFGRTHHLVQNAQLSADAENENAQEVRESVVLNVDRAYYAALRAKAVLRVAQKAVDTRQLLVDQTSALAQSKLKSDLDVTFAKVSLAQANLTLEKSRNDLQAAYAELSEAIGYPNMHSFELADEPAPTSSPIPLDQLLPQAMQRPDIARDKFKWEAAQKYTSAEKDLWLPSISLVASGGLTPWGDSSVFRDRYAAAGFNVNVPVFNGFLFNARKNEARLKEEAQHQQLLDTQNRAARDLRIAWLNANTAYRQLDLSNQLLDEAAKALDLAQERYKLGLSSIVELSQAQLNETEAEIGQAGAKYDYLTRSSELNYQAGLLR